MSETTQHTPGPWCVWEGPLYVGGGADLCIGAGGDNWLANMDHRTTRCPQIMENGHDNDECDICSIDSGHITAEQRANARLIAAAPDLLAALRAIMESSVDAEHVAQAQAAIDKATGGEG